MYGWGWTKFGQLGTQPIGSEGRENLYEPTRLASLTDLRASKISGGLAHSAIINDDDNEAYAFGKAADGRLGRGTPTTPIGHIAPVVWGPYGSVHVSQVSCGGGHTSVVDAVGRLFCFGKNEYGQLGIGTISDGVSAPTLVDALSGLKVLRVACGAKHTIVAVEGMNLYGFGANESGQLGTGVSSPAETSPVAVDSACFRENVSPGEFPQLGPHAISLAAGNAHSAVVFSGTGVFCWGSNSSGQCGCSTAPIGKDACVLRPTPVRGALAGKAVLSVSCGHSHTAAVDASGFVYAWGDNKHFQCAQGTPVVSEPAVVRNGALERALCVAVSCGAYHTVAVGAAGDVYACGLNDYGQVQGSEAQNVRVPYHIRGPLRDIRITDVSCGGRHTLALCAPPLPTVRIPPSAYTADFSRLLPKEDGKCLNGDVAVVLDADGTEMVLHKLFLARSRVLSEAIKAAGSSPIHIGSATGRVEFCAVLGFLYGQEVPSLESWELVAETLGIDGLSKHVTAETSQSLLGEYLVECLSDERFCDVTLVANDGSKISAHKVVLAARSRVFEKMFYGPFCEAEPGAEATLPNCSGSGLRTLIRYVYDGKSDFYMEDEDVLDLLEIADMHSMPGLKAKCEKHLSEGIDVDNAAFLYDVSVWYSARQLRTVCEQFISDNFVGVVGSEAFKEGVSDAVRDEILLKTTRFSLMSVAPPFSASFFASSSSSGSSSSSPAGPSPGENDSQNAGSWVGCSVQ